LPLIANSLPFALMAMSLSCPLSSLQESFWSLPEFFGRAVLHLLLEQVREAVGVHIHAAVLDVGGLDEALRC
jgi:hypothetical protein